MTPADLLAHAERLCRASPKRPRQVDPRRGVSAAYYAVFHDLCRVCANTLIGTGAAETTDGWQLAYRSVDHGTAKRRCKSQLPKTFPRSLGNFAGAFVTLQEERHRADYDPLARFSRSEALSLVETARLGIAAMKATDRRDRLAFAAYILLPSRG